MAPNRREKERLRQARLARERAENEAVAARRRRGRYAGAAGTLLVVAIVAVALVGSGGTSPSSRPPSAAAGADSPTASQPVSSRAALLSANTRQASQVLDSTIDGSPADR